VLKLATELLPEFFLFLGVDFFVGLSLLTCVMGHFRRIVPYLYQAAAVFGYVNLWMSRQLFLSFGEYMRFSYCLLYLALALTNIVGINVYLAVVKRRWTLGKVFASSVTFPTTLIFAFFFSLYEGEPFYVLTASFIFGAIVLGAGTAFMVMARRR